MSGYTEFQYAQTALRFGVWDYLAQALKKAELNRALEKLDHELGERAEQRQQAARVQNELQESMDTAGAIRAYCMGDRTYADTFPTAWR